MKKKAIIVSISGFSLSKYEKKIFSEYKPWGLILFKRNIKSINQLKKLTTTVRKTTKDKYFPIMIDEEGGAVTRISRITRHNLYQKLFGDIYKVNKKVSIDLYKKYLIDLIKFLKNVGININTVPVLDVLRKNTNKIIGNRSFSDNKYIVNNLGKICINLYNQNKVATVIKHIPGHGCTTADSHKKMPKVNLNTKDLNNIDFFPFKNSNSKFAMTAHILYINLDKKKVATFSNKIIKKVIRKKLRFKGVLISDDISMKALKYDLVTNAKKALSAGCNIVMYCGGNYKETIKLMRKIPYVDKFTSKKTSEFYKFLR